MIKMVVRRKIAEVKVKKKEKKRGEGGKRTRT